jgi:murein DD-endopeptidase MepM/ murein hydrolase activator NlpD
MFRFDWHRGVDIPTPFGSKLYSIDDGTVRLAGNYSQYTDTVVQIKHTGFSSLPVYSTYLHLSAVSVKEGDVVQKGQLIGFSGKPVSEFEHLHFELREGGVSQINCINPWKYLPYTPLSQNMKIEQADYIVEKKSLKILISMKPQESVFNAVEIEFLDKYNNNLRGNRKFDIDQVTKSTNEPTSLGIDF